jgi:hypothetical protein
MSALGHKQTFALQKGMSALPRKRHRLRFLADAQSSAVSKDRHGGVLNRVLWITGVYISISATNVARQHRLCDVRFTPKLHGEEPL